MQTETGDRALDIPRLRQLLETAISAARRDGAFGDDEEAEAAKGLRHLLEPEALAAAKCQIRGCDRPADTRIQGAATLNVCKVCNEAWYAQARHLAETCEALERHRAAEGPRRWPPEGSWP